MTAPVLSSTKRKVTGAVAWREARALIWKHRSRLTLGFILMMINRLAGMVLPATAKTLIDDVIPHQDAGR